MKQVFIVLTNYFKEHDLSAFVVKYLFTQDYQNLKIIIVDNGSHEVGVLQKLTADGRCHLLTPGSNLGYFGAAYLAYSDFYKHENHAPDVFIVSNFDLSFDRTGFISGIVSELDKTNAAVIGPAMKSSLNNAELNPIYKNRLTVAHIKRLLSVTRNYLVYLIYQKLHYIKRAISGKTGNDVTQLGDCYAIHGSFMIFKRQFFESNGTLNYGSFLYGEEIFVAEQCLRLGLKIAVTSNIEVIHHEHTTTGKMKDKRHMGYLNQSIQYLKKEYFLG